MAKTGDEVRAQFTVPASQRRQSKPADIVGGRAVCHFGQARGSARPVARRGRSSSASPSWSARVDVAPPETPEARAADPSTGSVADRARAAAEMRRPRAARCRRRGPSTTVVERLTTADFTPFVHPDKQPPAAGAAGQDRARPLLGPAPPEEPFSRTYVAVGVSRHGTQRRCRTASRCRSRTRRPPPTGGDGDPRRDHRDDRLDRAARRVASCAAARRAGRNRRRARSRPTSSPRPIMSIASRARRAARRCRRSR